MYVLYVFYNDTLKRLTLKLVWAPWIPRFGFRYPSRYFKPIFNLDLKYLRDLYVVEKQIFTDSVKRMFDRFFFYIRIVKLSQIYCFLFIHGKYCWRYIKSNHTKKNGRSFHFKQVVFSCLNCLVMTGFPFFCSFSIAFRTGQV